MSLKATVIIDTYNYGRFIERSIESALNQDFPKERYEILVIDDESTDDTSERIKKYGDKIRYIRQKNTGQAGVFNTGFANANGEVICFLDADDYWYPGKLKAVTAVFDKYPDVGLVQHPSDYVDENCSELGKEFSILPEFYDLQYFLNHKVLFNGTTNLSFRKAVIAKLMPEPLIMGNYADTYLCWNILFHCRTCNINTALAAHRIHGTNWYARVYSNDKMLEMYIKVMESVNASVKDTARAHNVDFSSMPPSLFYQETEILKNKIILSRKQWKLAEAVKAYAKLFGLSMSKYMLFKNLTLLLALLSPKLYLALFNAYSRSGFIPRLRERFLKHK